MTTSKPSASQLSRKGLARLHDSMAAHVTAGHLPGLVTLVARGDDVHIDTVGTPSFADEAPLARDAIFRIASLSKPVTAVATMSLVEEGLLRLEDPIGELVPELADRRVLRAIDAELDDTVPARRPITLEDLLSFRFGFGSVMAPPGSYPIQRAEAELGASAWRYPPPARRASLSRAASAGTAARAPRGARARAAGSPGSCSRNARPRRRGLLRWSRTSGPALTPPPQPPDPRPLTRGP